MNWFTNAIHGGNRGFNSCVCLKCIFDKLAYLMLGMEPMSNFLDIQSILSLFLGLGYEGQCLFKDDGAYCELSNCGWWEHVELLLTYIMSTETKQLRLDSLH